MDGVRCPSLFPQIALRRMRAWAVGVAAGIAWSTAPAAAPADEALIAELQRGAVLLLRHARTTPGVGDPPGWRLQDCASQRNLSDEGIAQARAIGDWFRAQGLVPDEVRHSPWCRTRDTARLAFGRGEPWPALANIWEDRQRGAAQADEVRRHIGTGPADRLVVLVSHGVTIAQILPEAAGLAAGEAVVVRAGDTPQAPLRVLGRLRWP